MLFAAAAGARVPGQWHRGDDAPQLLQLVAALDRGPSVPVGLSCPQTGAQLVQNGHQQRARGGQDGVTHAGHPVQSR